MILGAFLDCSRNSVFKIEQIKKYADYLAKLGYQELYIYTEDSFVLDGEPYFGYLRGKYTIGELKELDEYCFNLGIELIPTVQVLGHMGLIYRYVPYNKIIDNKDILLVGEEKTYEFIEKIILQTSKVFRSKKINICLDEAHDVGRGAYLDRFGYNKPYEILVKHLKRISKILDKYDYTGLMWSDLFFKFANNGKYSCDGLYEELLIQAVNDLPQNIEVIYWNYYSKDINVYDNMLSIHKKHFKHVSFAGGAVCWYGYAPINDFSLEVNKISMKSCLKNKVNRAILTLWQDGGGQCSFYSVLPNVVAWSEYAKGHFDLDSIKKKFLDVIGRDMDVFLTLDIPNKIAMERVQECSQFNPSLYMLYNDYFCGAFDCFVSEGDGDIYGEYAQKLSKYCKDDEFGYIFDLLSKLCWVLELKYDLGVKCRRLYQNKDKVGLKHLINNQFVLLPSRIRALHESFCVMWGKENKTSGLEVESIRLGGLIERTNCCKKLLEKFISDDYKIDELEEPMLDFYGKGLEKTGNPCVCNQYLLCATANVFSHGLIY